MLKPINGDSNSDSESESNGPGGSTWFDCLKKKLRSSKIKPHISSDHAHVVETSTDQLPLKDNPDVMTRNRKTTSKAPDAQSDLSNVVYPMGSQASSGGQDEPSVIAVSGNLTNSSKPIATAIPSCGWTIVSKLNSRYCAYERDAMNHPIEVIHTGSGLDVTCHGLYDADKTWFVLPE